MNERLEQRGYSDATPQWLQDAHTQDPWTAQMAFAAVHFRSGDGRGRYAQVWEDPDYARDLFATALCYYTVANNLGSLRYLDKYHPATHEVTVTQQPEGDAFSEETRASVVGSTFMYRPSLEDSEGQRRILPIDAYIPLYRHGKIEAAAEYMSAENEALDGPNAEFVRGLYFDADDVTVRRKHRDPTQFSYWHEVFIFSRSIFRSIPQGHLLLHPDVISMPVEREPQMDAYRLRADDAYDSAMHRFQELKDLADMNYGGNRYLALNEYASSTMQRGIQYSLDLHERFFGPAASPAEIQDNIEEVSSQYPWLAHVPTEELQLRIASQWRGRALTSLLASNTGMIS